MLIYYFFMAYLSWLNLIMINVWKSSVLHHWKISERIWYRLNKCYGWLTPILWVFIAIGLSVIFKEKIDAKNLNSIETAMFSNSKKNFFKYFSIQILKLFLDLIWLFFYLPLTIVVIINCILFVWTILALHKHGDDISVDRKTAISYK